MPQRYKLRLGDGTIVLVDVGGLNTWLVDDKAMVQAAGGWRPLKDVLALAKKRAAAKHASAAKKAWEQESKAPTPLPLVYPEPRKKTSGDRASLPLVYPPPRGEKPPEVSAAPPPTDLFEPSSMSKPAAVQAPAEEPPSPAPEETPPPIAEEGPPVTYKPLYEEEAPEPPVAVSQNEPLRLSRSEPLDLQAWVEEPEPVIPSPEPAFYQAPPGEEAAAIPPRPLYEEEAPAAIPPRPFYEEEAPAAIPPRSLYEEEAPEVPAPPPWHDPIEPPSISTRPSLQVLADDPEPGDGYTGRPAISDAGLPAISLKPRDDWDQAPAPPPPGPAIYEDEHDDFLEKPRGFVLDPRLVRAIDAFGGFLSLCVEHLERWYRQLRSKVPDAPATWRAGASRPSASDEPHPSVSVPWGVQALADDLTNTREETRLRAVAQEGPPVIRLKPLDGEGAPLRAIQDFFRRLRGKAFAWTSSLRGRVDHLVRRYRPAPSGPSNVPAVPSITDPTPPEPLMAPLPISELPVLRLVDIDEPKEVEDLYEGERESPFQAAWLWTKRIVFVTGVVAGGALAALNWETWFPKAAHLGGIAFTEVGEQLRLREQAQREQDALREATDRLPHLAPQTIRLILSSSRTGVLDPPEVFQRANDAADRGLSALTAKEKEQLKALQSALLDTLSPAENEHLREYEDARARRATFAFEDRNALELFARGARALPAESRERLQALLGKAIVAGIPLPTQITPRAVARR